MLLLYACRVDLSTCALQAVDHIDDLHPIRGDGNGLPLIDSMLYGCRRDPQRLMTYLSRPAFHSLLLRINELPSGLETMDWVPALTKHQRWEITLSFLQAV